MSERVAGAEAPRAAAGERGEKYSDGDDIGGDQSPSNAKPAFCMRPGLSAASALGARSRAPLVLAGLVVLAVGVDGHDAELVVGPDVALRAAGLTSRPAPRVWRSRWVSPR
jgi:hypothetical protein